MTQYEVIENGTTARKLCFSQKLYNKMCGMAEAILDCNSYEDAQSKGLVIDKEQFDRFVADDTNDLLESYDFGLYTYGEASSQILWNIMMETPNDAEPVKPFSSAE